MFAISDKSCFNQPKYCRPPFCAVPISKLILVMLSVLCWPPMKCYCCWQDTEPSFQPPLPLPHCPSPSSSMLTPPTTGHDL